MRHFIDFLKKLVKNIIGKDRELDPKTQLGLGAAIADDILDYLGHGDLGGDIDSIRFFADDPRIVGFLGGKQARGIMAERLRRERIPERQVLAEGIERGWMNVSPLGDAPHNSERIRVVKGLGATVQYEIYRRASKADCRITIEELPALLDRDGIQRTFLLSEIEAISEDYPFGRKSPRPQRDNSFVLPSSWTEVSRVQGAFCKKHGNWYVIQQNGHSRMKVDGEMLYVDNEAELHGTGKIDIEGHRLIYEIFES